MFFCDMHYFRFAASESNLSVVSYLIKQSHDAYSLLEDRKVGNCVDSVREILVQFFKNSILLFQKNSDIVFISVCLQFDGMWQEM